MGNVLVFVVVFFFWSIFIYAFVEWKLVSIPSFSIAVLTFGQPSLPESEQSNYFDEQRLSYIFNSTTVLRMILCTLPHLIIVATNTFLLAAQGYSKMSLEFLLTTLSSLLLIVSQIWPVVYSVREHGSFVEGMRHRRHPAFQVKRIDKLMRRVEGAMGLQSKEELGQRNERALTSWSIRNPIFARASAAVSRGETTNRKERRFNKSWVVGVADFTGGGDIEGEAQSEEIELQTEKTNIEAASQEATQELQRQRALSAARHRAEVAELKAELADAKARADSLESESSRSLRENAAGLD